VHHRGGFIRKGGKISKDHPKFKRGLNSGWIVKVDDSAAPSPKPEARVVEVPAPVEPKATTTGPEEDIPWLIADLDYLNNRAKESLQEAGVGHVGQLHGWSVTRLTELSGIGESTAEKLLVTYEQYTDEVGIDAPVINESKDKTVEYEFEEEED